MSSRCKVCNTPKVTNIDQINCDDKWECKICGNLLDAQVTCYLIMSDLKFILILNNENVLRAY